MSTKSNKNSYEIIIPSINDSQQGEDLINNINANFSTLANHDFIKGDKGDSVFIKKFDLSAKDNEIYIEKIKEAVIAGFNEEALSDVKAGVKGVSVFNIWDNIDSNPGYIYMICNKETSDGITYNDVPVSSLYYIFLDGRFANNNIGKINDADYSKCIDTSCIVIYENGSFKRYNAFPTIYLNKELGMCWKINGFETGIPAMGLNGKDGKNSNIYVVVTEKPTMGQVGSTNLFEAKVKSVLYNSEYMDVTKFLEKNINFSGTDSYTAIIICPESDSTLYRFHFGSIKLEGENLIASSSSDITLDNIMHVESFYNMMKSINVENNNGTALKGLLLPFDTLISDSKKQKVHLISSTSIDRDIVFDRNLNSDLLITPVKDPKFKYVSDSLKVDKYLYLKLNKDEIDNLLKAWNGKSINGKDTFNIDNIDKLRSCIKQILEYSNYILKYKLNSTISYDSIYKNYVFKNYLYTNSDCYSKDDYLRINAGVGINNNSPLMSGAVLLRYNIDGTPRLYGPNDSITDSSLYSSRVCAVKTENNNTYIATSNMEELIPEKFNLFKQNNNPYKDKHDKVIYRWNLDFTFNEFDIDELKESDAGINRYTDATFNNAGETVYAYKYPNKVTVNNKDFEIDARELLILFNAIFTRTTAPDDSSKILWFNGLGCKTYDNQYIWQTTGDSYISIYGWDYDSKNLFDFIKFIPTYTSKVGITNDASLNINYNVNITGDDYNPNHNLNVRGNITADKINAKNINTENINDKNINVKNNNNTFGIKYDENDNHPVIYFNDKSIRFDDLYDAIYN